MPSLWRITAPNHGRVGIFLACRASVHSGRVWYAVVAATIRLQLVPLRSSLKVKVVPKALSGARRILPQRLCLCAEPPVDG